MSAFSLTYFLNWSVQGKETLFKELIHHLFIICLYLRDHVTGDKANSCTGFSTVKPISIFVPINLILKKDNIGQKGFSI